MPKFSCFYQNSYVLIKILMFTSEHRIQVIMPMFLRCLIERELDSATPVRHQVAIDLAQTSIGKFHLPKCMGKSVHEH